MPHSTTFSLTTSSFASLRAFLYLFLATLKAIHVLSNLYFLQIFSLLCMVCFNIFTSSVNQGVGFHSGINLVFTGAWLSSGDLRMLSNCITQSSNDVDFMEESIRAFLISLAIFNTFTDLTLQYVISFLVVINLSILRIHVIKQWSEIIISLSTFSNFDLIVGF